MFYEPVQMSNGIVQVNNEDPADKKGNKKGGKNRKWALFSVLKSHQWSFDVDQILNF